MISTIASLCSFRQFASAPLRRRMRSSLPGLVDPATRVIEDPDGIAAEAPGPFERVVDLWPERVELAKPTGTGALKTFLVSDYDPASGTARMFLGTARDLTTYDLKRIYMGDCTVVLNPRTMPKGMPK